MNLYHLARQDGARATVLAISTEDALKAARWEMGASYSVHSEPVKAYLLDKKEAEGELKFESFCQAV